MSQPVRFPKLARRLAFVALSAGTFACSDLAAQTPPNALNSSQTEDQTNSAEDESGTTVSEVEITPMRDYPKEPGAVPGLIKPEVQYSTAQIQSFGVSTVSELLEEIEPETRSEKEPGGSPPVVLLNGRRTSSINEVINLPTEAIRRVDVLPEEAALQFGYPANQRVVNIVTKRNFRAVLGEVQGGRSDGGRILGQAEVNLLHLHRNTRLNFDLKYAGSADVTDVERGIIEPAPKDPFDLVGNVVSPTQGAEIDPALSALVAQPVFIAGVPTVVGAPTLSDFAATANRPNVTTIGRDRSLAPATQSLTANLVVAKPMSHGVNATLNATFSAKSLDSLHGLPGIKLLVPPGDPFSPFGEDVVVDRYVNAPRHVYADSWSGHLSALLDKQVKSWRFTLTGSYDHSDTQTDIDSGIDPAPLQNLLNADSPTLNPFGPLPANLIRFRDQKHARSILDLVSLSAFGAGPLFKAPAGDVTLSLKLGEAGGWLGSTSTTPAEFPPVHRSRNDASGQVSLDVPLTSARNHFLSFLGEFSVNANAAFDHPTDLGTTLRTFGYGLNWTPSPGYTLVASYSDGEVAPTLERLGAAVISTPGVRVFDFTRGETAEIDQFTGGNPGLTFERRREFKAGLTVQPFSEHALVFTANYIHSKVKNPILIIPAATPAFEQAFPDHFARDANGALTLEDERPINFASRDWSEIRWGFMWSHHIPAPGPNVAPLKEAETSPQDTALSGADPNRSADKNGRKFRSLSAGAPGGRFELAVYHTVYLTDREVLRAGGPVVDALNGGAASFLGGQYRNRIDGQLGVSYHGLGARLSAWWREGTTVNGAPGSPAGDLRFSAASNLNFRAWANFGQQPDLLRRYPWLRATRLTINVTNLLDEHISVRDRLGETPLAYQAGYVDPLGRTITVSIRKLFF